MKKFIFIIISLLFISGCSTTAPKGTLNEKNMPNNANSYNDSEVMQRLNDIKMGAKPVTKPTGKNPTPPNQGGEQEQDKRIKLDDLAKSYNSAILKTNFGDIKLEFYATASPLTVNNFLNLAKDGFYNGTKFHRVIKDFMIQGGDPLSKDDNWDDDGTGGPGYKFQDEINDKKLVRGSLAMANSGPNTNGSQFFIVTKEATPWLDGKHTNFGSVVSGMDIVDKIEAVNINENSHPTEDVIINSIELVK
jgi:cyclophilin family peptidyl-prolyl cis-trans isomerase